MKIHKTTTELALIEFSLGEVRVIRAALNEVCNGIDLPEFHSRIGAPVEEVESILRELGQVVQAVEKHSKD